MSTIQEMMNKLPPNMRLLLIAVVPALLVFLSEEINRSHSTAAQDPEFQHSFSKAQLAKVSSITNSSLQMLKSIDQMVAHPQSQAEEICLGGLRNGAYIYVSTMLDHLRVDIETSINMRNEDDETYINSGIAGSIAPIMKSLSKIDAILNQTLVACPENNHVTAEVNQMKSYLKLQVIPLLENVKTTVSPKPEAAH
jgi:hypothetical protein